MTKTTSICSAVLITQLLAACTLGAAQRQDSVSGPIGVFAEDVEGRFTDKDLAIDPRVVEHSKEFRAVIEFARKNEAEVLAQLDNVDLDWRVRALIAEALSRAKSAELPSVLPTLIAKRELPLALRKGYARVLARHGTAKAQEMAKRVVEDADVELEPKVTIMSQLSVVGLDDASWLFAVAVGEVPKVSPKVVTTNFITGIRWNAIRALGKSSSDKATGYLEKLVRENLKNAVAVEALTTRRDKAAVPVLIEVVKTRPSHLEITRQLAVKGLADLKAAEAVSAIIDLMRSSSANPVLIAECAKALAEIGDKDAVRAIEELLAGLDKDARFARSLSNYRRQEEKGFGPIYSIRSALKRLTR